MTSGLHHLAGPIFGFGSWLRENSEIEFTNGNFLSTSINLENKSAGDGCRDKTIKKTILRALRARTFSRGLGHQRTSGDKNFKSALPSITDLAKWEYELLSYQLRSIE